MFKEEIPYSVWPLILVLRSWIRHTLLNWLGSSFKRMNRLSKGIAHFIDNKGFDFVWQEIPFDPEDDC